MPTRLPVDTMIESRCFEHCAGRAKIFSSLIKLTISMTAFYLIVAVGDSECRIGKCCPYGQVLSISKEFTCHAVKGDNIQVIYQFYYDESEAGFLCPESENVTITALENIDDQHFWAESACIDILYEASSRIGIHVIFLCGPSASSDDALVTGSVAVPKLPNLRMCCGTGLTFDLLTRACIAENVSLEWQRERRIYSGFSDEQISPTLLCRSNDTGEAVTTSLATKNFFTLRICCSVDKVYSVDRRDCVPKEGRWNEPKNFPFLDGVFDFITVVRGVPPCRYALLDYVVDFTRDLHVMNDLRLEVTLSTTNGQETITVNENNMCLDQGDLAGSNLVVFRACSDSRFCMEHPCVRKCCPDDRTSDWTVCNEVPTDAPPGHFHDVLLNESIARGLASHEDTLDSSDYGLLIGIPCKLVMELHDSWHISPRGYVHLPNGKVYEHDHYCLEMLYDDETAMNYIYLGECEEPWEDFLFRIDLIHGMLEATSCVFLIITLLVYICLPVLRNLHGKILMFHMASLVVGYACFATITLAPIPPVICPFLGYATIFSWISAFSWLNVLCFDIWWTISGKSGSVTSEGQGDSYDKRFPLYSLYALGYTFLTSSICIAVDKSEFVPRNLRPNVGIDSCWFGDYDIDNNGELLYGEVIYFIIPVSLQLIANIILFTLTARHCSRVKAQITKMNASATEPRSQRFHAARKEFIITIKLFMVMGLTFIFQLIFVASLYLNYELSWYLGFMFAHDVVNCLHSFTIFFLFVINGRVYKALLNRIGRGSTSNIDPVDDAEALRARREVPSLLPIPTTGL